MKIVGKILTVLSLSSSIALALAGQEGGGGIVHVCKDSSGSVVRAETYDLYEGRTRYYLDDNLADNLSIYEYLSRAVEKIRVKAPGLAVRIDAALIVAKEQFDIGPTLLHEQKDANLLVKEDGCEDLQVAYWDARSKRIRVNASIWNSALFSNKSKAALYLHEAVYFLDRRYGQSKNSDDTRELVARVFMEDRPNLDFFVKNDIKFILSLGFATTESSISRGSVWGFMNWTNPVCYLNDFRMGTFTSLKLNIKTHEVYSAHCSEKMNIDFEGNLAFEPVLILMNQ